MTAEEQRVFALMRDTLDRIEALLHHSLPLEGGDLKPGALRMLRWAAAMARLAYGLPLAEEAQP